MNTSQMRVIGKVILVVLSGVLLSACAKLSYRQTPEGQAVGQTMAAFWSALRADNRGSLQNQLTDDATLVSVVERGPEVDMPLLEALNRQANRALLSAAEKAPLTNFDQPTPQRASLDTYLEITRREDIQRVRIHWNLVQDATTWRLNRIKTTTWTFPKPPRGGGP